MTDTEQPKQLERAPRFLNEMQDEVDEFNTSHGWKDTPRSFGDDMALLHSEVSEAFEAFRNWGTEDTTHKLCTNYVHESRGFEERQISEEERAAHLCKPEGIGSELADVLVRLLDTCARYDIDLEWEFNRKMEYNRTRPYRHGGKKV